MGGVRRVKRFATKVESSPPRKERRRSFYRNVVLPQHRLNVDQNFLQLMLPLICQIHHWLCIKEEEGTYLRGNTWNEEGIYEGPSGLSQSSKDYEVEVLKRRKMSPIPPPGLKEKKGKYYPLELARAAYVHVFDRNEEGTHEGPSEPSQSLRDYEIELRKWREMGRIPPPGLEEGKRKDLKPLYQSEFTKEKSRKQVTPVRIHSESCSDDDSSLPLEAMSSATQWWHEKVTHASPCGRVCGLSSEVMNNVDRIPLIRNLLQDDEFVCDGRDDKIIFDDGLSQCPQKKTQEIFQEDEFARNGRDDKIAFDDGPLRFSQKSPSNRMKREKEGTKALSREDAKDLKPSSASHVSLTKTVASQQAHRSLRLRSSVLSSVRRCGKRKPGGTTSVRRCGKSRRDSIKSERDPTFRHIALSYGKRVSLTSFGNESPRDPLEIQEEEETSEPPSVGLFAAVDRFTLVRCR